MAPSKQQAVVINADGTIGLQVVDVPKPGKGEILIKIVAAAQNPTDWKAAKNGKKAGAISGCDLAGIVEEIGPDVRPGLRTIGERVATMIHGGCYPHGAFSEYAVAAADRVLHVPDDWTLEEAAQLGVAPLTACQTLWESQVGLPTPISPASPPNAIPILVWGGASSVGNYVIQLAKLSGLYVMATASPKNFELCKSLGADEVFDYRDADVVAKIKESAKAKGGLKHAVDCVGEGGTQEKVANAMGEQGGTISRIIPPNKEGHERKDVKAVFSLSYELMGKAYEFPLKFSPTPEQVANGLKIFEIANASLATGKLRPSPTLIMPKGLASVPEGFQYMKDGKVSGQKITYRIADTPQA